MVYYRSKTRRPYAKKRYKKAANRYQTTDVRAMWPTKGLGTSMRWDPFPAKAYATLRYSTVINIVPTIGVSTPYNFRANSIFDPDASGIGHQPYAHDTYATIYNHYRVTKAILTMTCTAATNGIFGVNLADDTTVTIDYDGCREQKTSKYAVMSSNSTTRTVVQQYIDKEVYPDRVATTSGLFGQNPNEQQIFHCWWEGPSLLTTGSTANFNINIVYEVEMWELKELELS